MRWRILYQNKKFDKCLLKNLDRVPNTQKTFIVSKIIKISFFSYYNNLLKWYRSNVPHFPSPNEILYIIRRILIKSWHVYGDIFRMQIESDSINPGNLLAAVKIDFEFTFCDPPSRLEKWSPSLTNGYIKNVQFLFAVKLKWCPLKYIFLNSS